MRRVLVVAMLLVATACSDVVLGEVATTSSTVAPTATTSIPATTTTTIRPIPVGGHLVKYDLQTLRPIDGLEPIPMSMNSWNISSEDGEWMVILEHVGNTISEMVAVDVADWEVAGVYKGLRHSARVVDDGTLYLYDDVSGELYSLDLRTGGREVVGEWPARLWLWDDLHALPDGRVVGLGSKEARGPGPARYSVLSFDPVSGETGEIEIGAIERFDPATGIFDGNYEIPERDFPGVVWGKGRLLIVHAEGHEVTVVDFDTGEVVKPPIETTTWLDRLLAFWMPTAAAKGPSLGTYSSAALSPDGRFLFISGTRLDVVEKAGIGLVEESNHLGLTVVDTERWQVVDQPELPFQFVRESGDVVIGVDSWSTSPWMEDVYVVSIDDDGTVSHLGPFGVQGGWCFKVTGSSILVCSNYSETNQTVDLVDTGTGEVLATFDIGEVDSLLENGVLVDWVELSESQG